MSAIEQFLTYYIERGRDFYPRGYLRLFPDHKRLVANNRHDLINALYIGKDLFVNIFSEFQRRERDYDLIVIDIDDENLDNSLLKLCLVSVRLKKAGINYFRVTFSGSKGFHVYIHFENTRLSNYRNAIMGFLDSIGVLSLADTQSIEPNRVIRIPYTINTKTGYRSFVIGDQNEIDKIRSIEDIVSRSKQDFSMQKLYPFDTNVGLGIRIAQFDSTDLSHGKQIDPSSSVLKDFKDYPPCMKRLVSMATDETNPVDLNHSERTELAKFMVLIGKSDEEIAELYKKMSDYKEGTTLYQITYLRGRGMKMSGCDKLTDMGICCCDHDKCLFYPSINKYIMES